MFGESFLVIFNDMWCNLLKVLLVLSVLLFVVGCATHPPSAVMFMTSKKQTSSQDTLKTNVHVGFSLLTLGSINAEQTSNNKSINDELSANFIIQANLRYGYLAYGFGFQAQCPFGYVGFASEHFGTMLWSNIFSVLSLFERMGENESHIFSKNMGFGASVIEQIKLGKERTLGVTQHFSRTLAPFMEYRGSYPSSHIGSSYYYEFGGGVYFSFPLSNQTVGIETRYSRNYTYKADQLSLMVDFII